MKVRILINSNARAVKSRKAPEQLFRSYASEKVIVRTTHAVEEIVAAVEECWESQVDVVLLTTGDGGLHRFMSAFVNVYGQRRDETGELRKLPLFATLRTGTANLVTGILGGRGKPREALPRLFALLDRVRSREEIPRIRQKLLAVSDGVQQRFGFIAGVGLIHNFFLEYYRGKRHSVLKFVQIFSHMLWSLFTGTPYLQRLLTAVEARLQLDETRQRLSHYKMLAVSAIDARIVFFRAFRVGEYLDRIHIKGGNPSRLAIIRNLPNLLLNRRLRGRDLLDRLAARVRLEREDDFGYTIDGELYRARMLELAPGPVVEFVRF